jgi:hypothetical protein
MLCTRIRAGKPLPVLVPTSAAPTSPKVTRLTLTRYMKPTPRRSLLLGWAHTRKHDFVQRIVLALQDEQELQQAAAAIARLTPPGTPAFFESTGDLLRGFERVGLDRTLLDGGASNPEDAVKDLKRAVEAAGMDAMAFDEKSDKKKKGRVWPVTQMLGVAAGEGEGAKSGTPVDKRRLDK